MGRSGGLWYRVEELDSPSCLCLVACPYLPYKQPSRSATEATTDVWSAMEKNTSNWDGVQEATTLVWSALDDKQPPKRGVQEATLIGWSALAKKQPP